MFPEGNRLERRSLRGRRGAAHVATRVSALLAVVCVSGGFVTDGASAYGPTGPPERDHTPQEIPSTDAPISDAAMVGDLDRIRTLVASGADVNGAHGDGMTGLHWSAERGDTEVVALLLESGADVDPITRLGAYTPLHLGARAGQVEAVRLLLEAEADPRAETSTGSVQPLHFAARADQQELIQLLIAAGAPVDAREGRWGQTPLIFAASSGRTEAVSALLRAGADVSLQSAVLDIPAVQTSDRQASRVRRDVLDSIATSRGIEGVFRPAPTDVEFAVRAANQVEGVEAEVVEEEEIDFEEAQPSSGGFAELVGKQGGLTALLHAVREGHAETAYALLDAGADVNQASLSDRTSPILMAMINGHFDLGLELLARGADPSRASDAGTTPLYAALNTHWAPKARYPQQQAYRQQNASYIDVMRAVLEAGVDPDVRLRKHIWYMGYTFDVLDVDTEGATPFWRAAYATDLPAMQLLVEFGANSSLTTIQASQRGGRGDGTDPSGLPPVPAGGPAVHPIHAATGVGYGEGYAGNAHRHAPDGWMPSLRYLVEEHGADVNARDVNGYSPLHHAAARGDNEMIRYLVARGADITAVSRRGQTVADMANGPVQRISPFPETVALLEKLGSKNSHRCLSC